MLFTCLLSGSPGGWEFCLLFSLIYLQCQAEPLASSRCLIHVFSLIRLHFLSLEPPSSGLGTSPQSTWACPFQFHLPAAPGIPNNPPRSASPSYHLLYRSHSVWNLQDLSTYSMCTWATTHELPTYTSPNLEILMALLVHVCNHWN